MDALYKLTDENWVTRGHTKWGPGVTHTAPGNGELCTSSYLHAYRDPLVAVFMNPIHAGISDPIMWEAKGIVERDDGTKVGCTKLTTTKIIDLPAMTTDQRVKIAVLAAREVYAGKHFVKWARAWLDGTDRSLAYATEAAKAAASAAETAARAAEAAARAARAARAAAYAADTAAHVAVDAALDLVGLVHSVMIGRE